LRQHPVSVPDAVVTSAPIKDSGKPSCVVGVENIAFRGDTDEIPDSFADVDVSRESVIRCFDDKGMATGEALVDPQAHLRFCEPSENSVFIRLGRDQFA
jgi:hypothetical protein